MKKLETLIEEINVDKEIIGTLPRNNKKNQKICLVKLKSLYVKYEEYYQKVFKEIERRSDVFDSLNLSKEEKEIAENVSSYEKSEYILNENYSSYEKMGLDKAIFDLTYYYKNDLNKINTSIIDIINKFKNVGIKLTPKDFFFNKYVKEYITQIFEGKDFESEEVKSKFEEIYWKCPEIITYIELNIRYLYFKNEKKINKYYKKLKDQTLKNFSKLMANNSILEMKKTNSENVKKNKSIIIEKFLTNQLDLKDYTKESVCETLGKYIKGKNLISMSEDEMKKIILDLLKLQNSVEEFEKYNKYKFIIDDIKNIYKEKEKYKGIYIKTKKDISKKQSKMLKLGKVNFWGKSNEKNLAKQTTLLLDLKELYKQLDIDKVYNNVYTNINEYTNLYEVLDFAVSYYRYIFKCITNNNPEMPENEIFDFIKEIEEFLKWPYCTILNNIKITEEKDIMLIIKDRYNLQQISITEEQLQVANLESLTKDLKKCETYYHILENKIDMEQLANVYQLKKILKSN